VSPGFSLWQVTVPSPATHLLSPSSSVPSAVPYQSHSSYFACLSAGCTGTTRLPSSIFTPVLIQFQFTAIRAQKRSRGSLKSCHHRHGPQPRLRCRRFVSRPSGPRRLTPIHQVLPSTVGLPPHPDGLEGGFVVGIKDFEKSTHLLLAALIPPVRWRLISTLVARAGYLSMHPGRVFSHA
jgi:hypothetical protein